MSLNPYTYTVKEMIYTKKNKQIGFCIQDAERDNFIDI